jgi:hypothetical protein
MFEGVLDNGEDTIFLGNETKFTAMMNTLGEVMEEKQQPAEAPTVSPASTTAVPSVSAYGSSDADTANEPEPMKEESPKSEDTTNQDSPTPQAQPDDSNHSPLFGREVGGEASRRPQELVAQGISFLSGLAQTLQSPEATQQLVDTLVETNADTGESHLRIPVPDKQTVQTLLNFVGKLFAK